MDGNEMAWEEQEEGETLGRFWERMDEWEQIERNRHASFGTVPQLGTQGCEIIIMEVVDGREQVWSPSGQVQDVTRGENESSKDHLGTMDSWVGIGRNRHWSSVPDPLLGPIPSFGEGDRTRRFYEGFQVSSTSPVLQSSSTVVQQMAYWGRMDSMVGIERNQHHGVLVPRLGPSPPTEEDFDEMENISAMDFCPVEDLFGIRAEQDEEERAMLGLEQHESRSEHDDEDDVPRGPYKRKGFKGRQDSFARQSALRAVQQSNSPSTPIHGEHDLLYAPLPELDYIRIGLLAWLEGRKKKTDRDDKKLEKLMRDAQDFRSGYFWAKEAYGPGWRYWIPSPTKKYPNTRKGLTMCLKNDWLNKMKIWRRGLGFRPNITNAKRKQNQLNNSNHKKWIPRLPISYLLEIRQLAPKDIKRYLTRKMSWVELTQLPAIKIWRYPGVHESFSGELSARAGHFKSDPDQADSVVHDKIREIGINRCICVEVYAHLCKDLYTAQLGEAYTMEYGAMHNALKAEGRIESNIEYLITRPDAALDSDLEPFPIFDAMDGIELYEIIPNTALVHPDYHATKDEIIQFPYRIHQSSLIDRFIVGTRGNKDNIWRHEYDALNNLVRRSP